MRFNDHSESLRGHLGVPKLALLIYMSQGEPDQDENVNIETVGWLRFFFHPAPKDRINYRARSSRFALDNNFRFEGL